MATIVSLVISLYASSPLSNIFKIYQVEGIGEIIGDVVNRFIIFLILLACLKLLLFFLGLIIKPILKKIIYAFKLFEHIDRLLGIIASFIEGMIIIYLGLVFIIMPILSGGKEAVENTIFAKRILNLVPTVTNEIEAISNVGMVIDNGINYDSFNSENIYYIALPIRVKGLQNCNNEMIEDLKWAYEESSPDIVHIIGTEREHNLKLLEIANPKRTIVSITGMVTYCSIHYYGGIEEKNFKNLSLGDILRHGGPIREKRLFERYSISEKQLI